ncbi:MAG: efflux RND transporter periplasmic adaptor subunit [Bradyrhizobium sp.]|uniref:efflux RND transporter periplasmic adaptor subunit n=1 Tax=Bradyrhizobium sp. TaxID=376 RepID=UPI0025C200DE|nr:efflux RND transporter periplasmic adaptor subunit [Bradyrhizobium sp.]MBI5261700.1 efflux RND transporter periplasmic adaptor subunit [Bradyrhizobium sp.]
MEMKVAPPSAAKTGTGLAATRLRVSPLRLVSVALPLLVLVSAGWWLWRGPTITVVNVSRGDAAEIVYATGAVEPETWSRSTPLVRGRIVERCRCEGKLVKAGDVLARLDDKEPLATLNDLRALEVFQRREFDRQTQLLERGATTSQSYQRAESDLARIQAQIAAQTQRLDHYKLLAPMDGVVLKEDGEVGDMVDPGTILYRIGLEKPLWVVADVNEEDIPRVQIGQKALLRTDAFANQPLSGHVKQITPAGDPVSKTFRVRIGLPDDTPLRVGMSVEANIITREKRDVVLVPANAVVNNGVFVIENDRARIRKISTGIRGSGFVEVLDGVREGDVVASPATTNIRDGSRVRSELTGSGAP